MLILLTLAVVSFIVAVSSLSVREGQSFVWQTLPVQVQPVLPGTVPVLAWFAQERGFQAATHLTLAASTASG